MIKVYDMMTTIHSKAAEKVEVLDEMLNQYGIDHSFMYATAEQMKEDEDAELNVLYMEEDEITFDLVVMLFCKTALNKSDEEIKKAMKKVAA